MKLLVKKNPQFDWGFSELIGSRNQGFRILVTPYISQPQHSLEVQGMYVHVYLMQHELR